MAVVTTNIVAGPATVYYGAFGATEPASSAIASAPSSAIWTDFGGTNDGTTIDIALDYFELEVDQIVDRVGSRLQKREISVTTNLAETTLTNLKTAINGGTIAGQQFEPLNDSSATQPNYAAIIVDGFAPGLVQKRRRFIVRKVLNTEAVGLEYKKDGQTMIPIKMSAHYVSSSAAPFVIHDEA